jgi:hypothetical protein
VASGNHFADPRRDNRFPADVRMKSSPRPVAGNGTAALSIVAAIGDPVGSPGCEAFDCGT